jgi:hypothetical protein
MKSIPVNWRRPVPLWVLLIGILVTASATTAVIVLPSVLSPKPDFTISISSLQPMYVQASGYNHTLITIQTIRNFTGIVTVTTLSSTGVSTLLFDPQAGGAKDQILLGNAGSLGLAVNDKEVGNFTVTVIASSGAISHSASFPVIVENLTMTSSPPSLTIMRGSSGTTEINLSSVNGLSGNVSLGPTVYTCCVGSLGRYSVDSLSSASVAPTSIILSLGGTGKIALTINVGLSDSNSVLFVVVSASMVRQLWNFNLTVQVNVV